MCMYVCMYIRMYEQGRLPVWLEQEVQARGHEMQTANIRINRQANIILQMESGSETKFIQDTPSDTPQQQRTTCATVVTHLLNQSLTNTLPDLTVPALENKPQVLA